MPGTYKSPAESALYYLQSRYYDPELGRFINADAYASTGQGVLGNNMFAYCGNNPIGFSDKTGNARDEVNSISAKCADDVWAIGYGAGGIPIFYPIEWLNGFWGKAKTFFNSLIHEQEEAVVQKVKTSLQQSNRGKWDGTMHEHHIVPQNDLRGLPSFIILQEVFPGTGVNDPRNLVLVSSRIHARLHSNEYYLLVNLYITIAYLSAGDNAAQKEANVSCALSELATFIQVLELL